MAPRNSNSMHSRRIGLSLMWLNVGSQFTVLAAQSSSTTPRRRLAPRMPSAEESLHLAQTTRWNHEVRAASEWAKKSRRRLRRPRQQQRRRRQTQLRQLRYNDYLPEDAPGSLLALVQNNNEQTTTTTCLSPLQKWFVSLIESIGMNTWDEIEYYNITSLAYLYKHHVSSSDGGEEEYFGTYGDRTDEMRDNHQSLTEFWYSDGSSSSSSNVILLGMHGVDLADDTKLLPTLQQIYHLEPSQAFSLAGRIQAIIESLPGTYNNPVLTANAIAIQSLNPDGSQSERDSIIIGDGVFAFLEWLNLKSDGPDYIHAHEYGHHLQYDLGLVTGINNAEWSKGEEMRRWETMADVFGSYYLAHESGGGMSTARLEEVHRAAFSLGDCADAIGTHHGTPAQRECASNYGAALALESSEEEGYRIPPGEVRRLFDENYVGILELKENLCGNVVDGSVDGGGVAPAGAPQGGSTNGYYAPQSEYVPYDSTTQHNDGWTQGTTFEAYDPDAYDSASTTNNQLDAPPPTVKSGTYDGMDNGWFGNTEATWQMTRSGGVHLGVRSTLIVAAVWKILLLVA